MPQASSWPGFASTERNWPLLPANSDRSIAALKNGLVSAAEMQTDRSAVRKLVVTNYAFPVPPEAQEKSPVPVWSPSELPRRAYTETVFARMIRTFRTGERPIKKRVGFVSIAGGSQIKLKFYSGARA